MGKAQNWGTLRKIHLSGTWDGHKDRSPKQRLAEQDEQQHTGRSTTCPSSLPGKHAGMLHMEPLVLQTHNAADVTGLCQGRCRVVQGFTRILLLTSPTFEEKSVSNGSVYA